MFLWTDLLIEWKQIFLFINFIFYLLRVKER